MRNKIPGVLIAVIAGLICFGIVASNPPCQGVGLRFETSDVPPNQPLAVDSCLNYTILAEEGEEEALDVVFSLQIINENATHWVVGEEGRAGDMVIHLPNVTYVWKTSSRPTFPFFANGELSVEWDWGYWLNSTALTSSTRLNRLDEELTVIGRSRVTVAAGTFEAWKSYDEGSRNTLHFEKTSGILLKHVDEDGAGFELTGTNIVQGLPGSEIIPGFDGKIFLMVILGVIFLKNKRRNSETETMRRTAIDKTLGIE
ncbi:MAG: hypothetical protein ACE5OZ_20425 [Candidatus Heimdallarchaeota archaeon]